MFTFIKSKKKIVISSAIVVAVIIIGGIFWNKSPEKEIEIPSVDVTEQEDLLPASEAEKPVDVAKKPTAIKPLSYQQALLKYEGRRFQFKTDCQASPFQSTFKNGTEIMLDNRASTLRTIKVDTKVYTLPAYSFKIVKLSFASSALPKTLLVDCNGSQNVATILVQK